MPIVLHLDEVMADRHISLNELADKVGITNVNLSRIKTGKVRAVRFSTLDMLCEVLKCQPGDILKHVSADEANAMFIDENAEIVCNCHLTNASKTGRILPRAISALPVGM